MQILQPGTQNHSSPLLYESIWESKRCVNLLPPGHKNTLCSLCDCPGALILLKPYSFPVKSGWKIAPAVVHLSSSSVVTAHFPPLSAHSAAVHLFMEQFAHGLWDSHWAENKESCPPNLGDLSSAISLLLLTKKVQRGRAIGADPFP